MPRLGSKKSRKGCKRCRQRHVKCDEKGPCANCVRRHEQCDLPIRKSETIESRTNSIALAVDVESKEDSIPLSHDIEWIQDMKLMHHYVSNVSTTEGIEPMSRQSLWRDYIPQQALIYPFLLHGILALSALHLAYLERKQSTKYLRMYDKHQAIALAKFRTTLSSEIDPDMAGALFALATTLSVSSTARSCAVPEKMPHPAVMDMNDVAELFFLTKGVRDIIRVTGDYVRKGPMAPIFDATTYPDGIDILLPSTVSDQLEALHRMIAEYGLDLDAAEHCHSALRELEHIYRNIQYWAGIGEVEIGHVWQWQTRVTNDFVKLIQARSPPALVILAYYAAAMGAVQQTWFTQNWAQFTIRGVSFELPARMQHWIEWPLQQVREGMAVLGVTVSKEDAQPMTLFIGF